MKLIEAGCRMRLRPPVIARLVYDHSGIELEPYQVLHLYHKLDFKDLVIDRNILFRGSRSKAKINNTANRTRTRPNTTMTTCRIGPKGRQWAVVALVHDVLQGESPWRLEMAGSNASDLGKSK